jgi:hypothetical protein
MKKLISLFVLLFSIHSQAMEVSPLVGFQLNQPATEGDSQVSYTDIHGQGWRLGVLLSYDLTSDLSLRTGLLWSERYFNGTFDIHSYGVSTGFEERASYLDLPINVKWNMIPDLYIYGGMIYASKLSDNMTYNPSPASLGLAGNQPFRLKGYDFLINAGLGYSFWHLANSKFSAELEYNYGLCNLDDTTGSQVKMYNRNLALTVLYSIPL